MDPNAEEPPSMAEMGEMEAEVDFGLKDNPVIQPPLQAPLSTSIFQGAFGDPTRSGRTSRGPDDLQQYNEEEFQRKLRGDYEAAQQRLSTVVSDNMSRPLRLTSIRLSPTPSGTRSSFLNSLLNPFLALANPSLPAFLHPAPPPPETLHDILLTTRALVSHLERFQIFDMDRARIRLEPRRGGDGDEVELVLGLRERGKRLFKVGSEVGGGEGSANMTGRLNNALGGAETLELNASIGTKTKSAYQLALSTPLFASPLLSFALSAFSLDRDNSAFASHREQSQGGRAKFSAIAPWGTHDLIYDYVQRDIGHLSPGASVSVRELAEPSTKASLIHTWTSDTRDSPWLSSEGSLWKMSQEYAGLPGSSDRAHFFKSTLQSAVSRPLYPNAPFDISVAFLTTVGYPLYPRGPTSRTYLPDRIFLGGPNSIRGWKVGGLGLRDGQDSLGGDLGWALGTSLFAALPGITTWPLKLHTFVNLGKVVGYDSDQSFADNLVRMYRNPNVSVGLGLRYRLEPIVIELNFTLPLVARRGERTARGFGVGVGVEFL